MCVSWSLQQKYIRCYAELGDTEAATGYFDFGV